MPTANVVWQSVEELARIQIEYLKSLANAVAGGNTGQRQEGNGGKPVFPLAADGGGSCGRRGNLLRFRAGICRGVI